MSQANVRTSVSMMAGKRKVIPSFKVIASKFQSVAQSSRSQEESEMDVDRDTVVGSKKKAPEVVIPLSRKRSAPSQPVEDVPLVLKLAHTSHSSLLSCRPPSHVSSSSSRQVPDNTSMGSFSPTGLGPPMFGAQMSDPILLRLNILEDMNAPQSREGNAPIGGNSTDVRSAGGKEVVGVLDGGYATSSGVAFILFSLFFVHPLAVYVVLVEIE